MDILINKTDNYCKLTYDLYGNLYLKYDNILYNIVIDDGNLFLLKINEKKLYDFSDVEINHIYSNIKSKVDPLKAKINETLEKQNIDNIDYFPEEKFVEKSQVFIETEYMNEMDIDPMFIFYTNDKFIKNKREYEQSNGYPFNSLYNFSIIKGTIESTDVMISTEEFNNTCAYNIIVYTCGLIKLNIIGQSQNIYKIINEKNKLNLLI